MTNIERHAEAILVRMLLTSGNGIQLLIADDGKGMARSKDGNRSSGLGLRNMQERMEHFGGSLDIESGPAGTILKARLPKSIFVINRKELEPARP